MTDQDPTVGAPPPVTAAPADADPADEQRGTTLGRDRFWWTEHVAVALLAVTSILTAWRRLPVDPLERRDGPGVQFRERPPHQVGQRLHACRAAADHRRPVVHRLVEAVAGDDPALAVYLRSRFRPEFLTAFDTWLGRPPGSTVSTTQVPSGSPFDTYRPATFAEADALSADADAAAEEAQLDNQRGDNYILTTVLLAVVLFFAGIAPRFRTGGARRGHHRRGRGDAGHRRPGPGDPADLVRRLKLRSSRPVERLPRRRLSDLVRPRSSRGRTCGGARVIPARPP